MRLRPSTDGAAVRRSVRRPSICQAVQARLRGCCVHQGDEVSSGLAANSSEWPTRILVCKTSLSLCLKSQIQTVAAGAGGPAARRTSATALS